MATDLTVAQTILEQLGGRRFTAMTGARDFTGADRVLTFRLPRGFAGRGINAIRITLTVMDDYTVEALKVRACTVAPIACREGVYADNLRAVFTSITGLDTSL